MIPHAVSVLQQQHALHFQAAEAVTLRVDPAGIRTAGKEKPVVEQIQCFDAAKVVGQCEEQHVEFAVHQPAMNTCSLILDEVQL